MQQQQEKKQGEVQEQKQGQEHLLKGEVRKRLLLPKPRAGNKRMPTEVMTPARRTLPPRGSPSFERPCWRPKSARHSSTTLSQANTILSNIQTDPKWGWASGKESSGEISRIKKEIDDLVAGDDFTRELLSVTDLAELKGQEGRNDSALATLLNTFTAAMDPKVGSLIYQCKVLLAQYKARLSV